MRDKSIDVLKGMAILFVIYYHVLWAAVGFKESPTNVFFNSCCMQLFFFISGYLSFRSIPKKELRKYVSNSIIKKTRYLLLPTILMFLFSIWFFNLDLNYWCKNNFHNGYWFTYVLFFVFLLYYLVYLPFVSNHNNKWKEMLVMSVTFFMMICSGIIESVFNNDITLILSFPFLLKYCFFFSLGHIFSKYKQFFGEVLEKNYIRIIIFVVAVIPLHFIEEGFRRHLLECIVSPARVIVVFRLVNSVRYFGDEHFVSNQLAKVGRHSLEIYFLHYYFIFGMPKTLEVITQQLDLYVVRGPGSTLTLELIIIIPISVVIAYLCMLTRSIVNFAPPHLCIAIWSNTQGLDKRIHFLNENRKMFFLNEE